jgi:hypothetical protein
LTYIFGAEPVEAEAQIEVARVAQEPLDIM